MIKCKRPKGVRHFTYLTWKWWHNTEEKLEEDVKVKAAAIHDADAQESPTKTAKKANPQDREERV